MAHYSLALASLYISIATAGQILGVACGWVIPEHVEKRKVTAFTMLLHATGMLTLTYATGPVVLVLSALVHGVGWGLRGPFISAMRADYFGRSSIGMILGLSSMIMVIGQIGGPLIAGRSPTGWATIAPASPSSPRSRRSARCSSGWPSGRRSAPAEDGSCHPHG